MSRAIHLDASLHAQPGKGQIANKVQELVAHNLSLAPKPAWIQDALVAEYQRIV